VLDFTGPSFALPSVICVTAELSPNAPAAREFIGPFCSALKQADEQAFQHTARATGLVCR
jgi:hypothetical protein